VAWVEAVWRCVCYRAVYDRLVGAEVGGGELDGANNGPRGFGPGGASGPRDVAERARPPLGKPRAKRATRGGLDTWCRALRGAIGWW